MGRNGRFYLLLLAWAACIFMISACKNALPASGQRGMEGITVIVDAGHGDTDVGTIGVSGCYEKDVNIAIAQKLKEALEAKGAAVIMTRESDEPIDSSMNALDSLEGRKEADMLAREEIIDNAGADLLVSIHQNSFEDPAVSGPQLFYLKNADTGEEQGAELAKALRDTLKKKLQIEKMRPVSYGNWRLLKKGNQPGCIVECGFFSNAEEEALLQTEEYQQKFAEALAEGLETYSRRR